jgi:recombination associated protein RdgC
MPVKSGSVTFARFRSELAGGKKSDAKRWLLRGLKKKAFQPLEAKKTEEDRAVGFVELENQDGTEFEVGLFHGEHVLFAWRVDAIKVSAAAVKVELERWATAFAAEHGRPATKRERAGRRDEVRELLRQRAAPTTRVHDVSWNLSASEVAIWAASRKVVEEVAIAMEEVFGVKLHPVSVGATAAKAGLPEKALGPTAALVGLEGLRAEVDRGEK